MTPEESTELNDFIHSISDISSMHVKGLEATGKSLPYIGWFWREVDFTEPTIRLGDCGDFVGFMENNKWDYPQWRTKEEQTAEIVKRLLAMKATVDKAIEAAKVAGIKEEHIVHYPSQEVLQEFFDYMQTLKPPKEEPVNV
jgi:hypothetical protein